MRSEAQAGPAALELKGVARRFGLRWALRGVSVRVAPGEVVSVLGPNGSGKTTLLRVASTALRPTHGEGTVYGHDLVREAGAVRELIGYFGFAPAVYDDLTAAENLRFAVRMTGRKPERRELDDALDRVGLAAEANERARNFSSGMRRRLALARLILIRPKLLLLDEPYASFDEGGIRLLNDYLAEVKRAGCGVLLATHDLERVSPIADRSMTIEAGRVVAWDPPDSADAGTRAIPLAAGATR